jgi:DNA mismatch repair protein MutL
VPEFVGEGIEISGFIGKAGISRSSRQQQLVFLNGRAVENNTLSFALREGYHTALMKGQHPVTFLFIQMDPAAVDVNVHPAKREVRFRDAAGVREVVAEAVRRTIESDRAQWTQTFRAGPAVTPEPALFPQPAQASLPIPQSEQVSLRRDWASASPPVHTTLDAPVASSAVQTRPDAASLGLDASAPQEVIAAGEFRILGVLGKLYVLMENASGLVLVDQHAAHERILFEEMRKRMEEQGVPSQRLLIPLTMQVTPRDADWLLRHLEVLERAGIALEPFGSCTFKIDTLPTFLKTSDPSQLVRDIIDDLRDTSTQTSKLRLGEEMIAKTVCRHAVKANDYLREPELVRLVRDLLACELPYCCPHGRPTMIQMSYGELEKKFGRKV